MNPAARGVAAKAKAVVAVAVEHRAEGRPGRPPVPGFAALQVVANAGARSLEWHAL